MIKLTLNETNLLNAMRQNEYNDALEGATWTFTAIDNSGIPAKQARGVISSLIKKGLVTVTEFDTKDDPETIGFTEAGIHLFDNADGEECNWGGPRLLKIIKPVEKEKTIEEVKETIEALNEGKIDTAGKTKEVTVIAFTGMVIGTFKIVKETKTSLTVKTNKGKELVFDKKTLVQTNAKNVKFANKIVK